MQRKKIELHFMRTEYWVKKLIPILPNYGNKNGYIFWHILLFPQNIAFEEAEAVLSSTGHTSLKVVSSLEKKITLRRPIMSI